jgi:hypothetical protein
MPERPEVQFLVLSDRTRPFLLARVRWPDVAQAISAGCPEWLDDVGLFDLPNDPSSIPVSAARAAEIALGWGAQLPSETTVKASRPALVRRMPANWSNLTPAERRAWSLDVVTIPRRSIRVGRRAGARAARARAGVATEVPRPDITVHSAPSAPLRDAEFEPQLGITAAAPNGGTPDGTWDPETEPVPAMAATGPTEPPNGAATNGARLPAVFSRMAGSPGTVRRRVDLSHDRPAPSVDVADSAP